MEKQPNTGKLGWMNLRGTGKGFEWPVKVYFKELDEHHHEIQIRTSGGHGERLRDIESYFNNVADQEARDNLFEGEVIIIQTKIFEEECERE